MIEIKEEDIIIEDEISQADGSTYYFLDFGNSTKEKAEQLKQQILQDHEDAEYWHKWVGNQSLQKILDVWKKDRQMIEKIKECLKNVHFTDEGEVLITELGKILKEEK